MNITYKNKNRYERDTWQRHIDERIRQRQLAGMVFSKCNHAITPIERQCNQPFIANGYEAPITPIAPKMVNGKNWRVSHGEGRRQYMAINRKNQIVHIADHLVDCKPFITPKNVNIRQIGVYVRTIGKFDAMEAERLTPIERAEAEAERQMVIWSRACMNKRKFLETPAEQLTDSEMILQRQLLAHNEVKNDRICQILGIGEIREGKVTPKRAW